MLLKRIPMHWSPCRCGFPFDAFKKHVAQVANQNINLAPKPIDFDSEGEARLELFRKCPLGTHHLCDPTGTMIDVAERR